MPDPSRKVLSCRKTQAMLSAADKIDTTMMIAKHIQRRLVQRDGGFRRASNASLCSWPAPAAVLPPITTAGASASSMSTDTCCIGTNLVAVIGRFVSVRGIGVVGVADDEGGDGPLPSLFLFPFAFELAPAFARLPVSFVAGIVVAVVAVAVVTVWLLAGAAE